MIRFPKINIDDYDYQLPEDRIAQYPVAERDKSKLLLYKNGKISEDTFRNIVDHLPGGSLLVFNNTRVIRARLLFRKNTGAAIELFCLEPLLPADYEQSFSSVRSVEWKCLIGNLKKWKSNIISSSFVFKEKEYILSAEKIKSEGEAWRIRFSWEPEEISFSEVTEAAGHIPLPPYVNRDEEFEDNVRYQTVYSSVNGSVAAPTAGLHFTGDVLSHINNKGIRSFELTLHIGAGTFKPVRTNDVMKHEMHCEHFIITKELVEMLLAHEGRIIAVGTTTVRTLESLFWLGVKILRKFPYSDADIFIGQWEPYEAECKIEVRTSMEALLALFIRKRISVLSASTKIMLIPGYEFRMIRGMFTNFHQPKSTLLLLLSAWTGPDWKRIYDYALENDFRFLSFGDSSLLMK